MPLPADSDTADSYRHWHSPYDGTARRTRLDLRLWKTVNAAKWLLAHFVKLSRDWQILFRPIKAIQHVDARKGAVLKSAQHSRPGMPAFSLVRNAGRSDGD
jgi:hypothetical protein